VEGKLVPLPREVRHLILLCFRPRRSAGRWLPDAKFLAQFDGPVMYPNEEQKTWTEEPYHGIMLPTEKTVKNLSLNFGPQHPAAHGVLRLVLELDGEVVYIFWFSLGMIPVCFFHGAPNPV